MKYRYYFLSGTQEVRYDIGAARLEPDEGVTVNSVRSYRVTYRVGRAPVEDGGAVRFSIPLPFSPPQLDEPRGPGYVKAVCSRKGTELSLSLNLSPFTGFSKDDGHCGAYARSVFVGVGGRRLEKGDTLTLHYSKAKAPHWSSPFDFAVFVDPDGRRRAKNSGYYIVARFPRLYVEPKRASRFVVYLPSRLRNENPVVAVARDSLDNYDRNYGGEKRLLPGGIPLRFKKGIARARAAAGGKDVLRVRVGRNVSNPSKRMSGLNLYWGDLHAHSLLYDGLGTPGEVYTYGRDAARLDFQSVSEHSFYDPSMWEHVLEAAAHFDRPGRFVTFVGYEARTCDFGDINFYFPGGRAPQPPPTRFNGGYNEYPLEKYVASIRGHDALVIPHCHLKPRMDYPAELLDSMPLVEIYSQWGNFERPGRPFTLSGKKTVTPPQSIVRHLVSGLRLGFSGGSDNHSAHAGYGSHMRAEETFRGGLTAVYAEELSRRAIWDAILRRRCYATTGCRMIIDFSANGVMMGSEGGRAPGVRAVRASVNGQGPLKRLVIVRNGDEVKTIECGGKLDVEIEWADEEKLDGLWLPKTKLRPNPFIFYYLRVEQEDGEIGWASPVWFDNR